MRCPRCHTKLSDDATHCPDCKLPKLKRAMTSEGVSAVTVEEAQPKVSTKTFAAGQPPKSIYAEKILPAKTRTRPQPQVAPKPAPKQSRISRKKLAALVAIPLLVTVIGAAAYWFILPMLQPEQIEPQAALTTVNRFRQLPSNDEGLTVDERMKKEIDALRKLDNLHGYQGWTTRPVKGDKTKVVIAFSFEMKDKKQQRAEWIADVAKNVFIPQNELAAAIYKR